MPAPTCRRQPASLIYCCTTATGKHKQNSDIWKCTKFDLVSFHLNNSIRDGFRTEQRARQGPLHGKSDEILTEEVVFNLTVLRWDRGGVLK